MSAAIKNILITGATSFIGKHLIKHLANNNTVKIYAVVRERSAKNPILRCSNNIEIIKSDLKDYDIISSKIHNEFDVVVHLAWDGVRGEARNNEELQKNNYNYSVNLLNESIKLGCKRFISAGSQAEYGFCKTIVSENTECRPNTEYGKWKLEFFNQAYEICAKNEIDLKEPRFFSLYGADDFEGTMIISILKKMLKNEPCELTQAIQMWNFLHVDDAANGIEKLIYCDCANGAYNFGSGDTRILKEFIDEMKIICDSKSELKYGAIPYPTTGMVTIAPDITKLKSETAWTPKISFNEGIKDIIYRMKKVI